MQYFFANVKAFLKKNALFARTLLATSNVNTDATSFVLPATKFRERIVTLTNTLSSKELIEMQYQLFSLALNSLSREEIQALKDLLSAEPQKEFDITYYHKYGIGLLLDLEDIEVFLAENKMTQYDWCLLGKALRPSPLRYLPKKNPDDVS